MIKIKKRLTNIRWVFFAHINAPQMYAHINASQIYAHINASQIYAHINAPQMYAHINASIISNWELAIAVT